MNPAISEWTWALFALLLRTGVITTVLLLAAFLVTRWNRRASAAVRHRIWHAAVLGCWVVPMVLAFVPVHTFSVSSPLSEASSLTQEPTHEPAPPDPADVEIIEPATGVSESVPSGGEIELPAISELGPIDADEDFAHPPVSIVVHNSTDSPKSPAPRETALAAEPVPSSERDFQAMGAWLFSSPYPFWFVAAWLMVAIAVTLRILRATMATRKMVRQSVPVSEPAALTLLNEVCSEMGVRAPVQLRLCQSVDIPMVTGMARPVMLLPADALGWSKDRLAIVLRHELAHVVRRDLLSQLLADFGTAILWYQPLLWYASRRLRVEREFACDDLVLQTGTPPCDYADELLAVASKAVLQQRRSPVAVSMAGRSTVEHRIWSILDPKTNRGSLGRLGMALVVLIGTALVLIATSLTPNFSITADDAHTTKADPAEQPTSSPEESMKQAVTTAESNDKRSAAKKEPAQLLEKISGQVVDVSGKPVSSAQVWLDIYGQDPQKATTDAEGRFRFDVAKMRNAVRLKAQADEGRRLGLLQLYRNNLQEEFQEAKLTLEPAKEAVIRVVGAQGQPIKDATAGVIAGYGDTGSARTGADGTARVLVPRSLEIRQVYAMKDGIGFDYKSFTVPRERLNDKNYTKPAFPAEGVTLTLDGVQPLKVKVLSADVLLFGVMSPHDTSVHAQATFSASDKPLTKQYAELRQRVSATRAPAAAKRLVFDAFTAMDEAWKADDYAMAIRIGDLAVEAARKSHGSHMMGLAGQRKEQAKSLAGEYAKLRSVPQKVKTDSADAEDYLAFGRFLCLAAGDWQRGLPLLARSDLTAWRNLARMERGQPESAAKQMQWAAAGARAAAKETGDWQQRMERRAYHWYQQVLRRSAGQEREKVTQAMDQLSFAYLTDMKEKEVRKGPWKLGRYGDCGDGRPILVDGIRYENALGLHPPASVTFPLNGKYKSFVSAVAISDNKSRIRGRVVFQVLGDNRLLWKSKPMKDHGDVDLCRVSVEGIRILELRTQSVKSNHGLHAAWLAPQVSR